MDDQEKDELSLLPKELLLEIVNYLTEDEVLVLRETSSHLKTVTADCLDLRIDRLTIAVLHKLQIVAKLGKNVPEVLQRLQHPLPEGSPLIAAFRLDKNTGKNEYAVTVPLATKERGEKALFKRAHIRHFEINKSWPLHMDDGELESLGRLFKGCSLERITLLFDVYTLHNLVHVPSFLTSVPCKTVEFFIHTSKKMLNTRLEKSIAGAFSGTLGANLRAAGVDKVVLNYCIHLYGFGREKVEPPIWTPKKAPRRGEWLYNLLDAGLHVEVEQKVIDSYSDFIDKHDYAHFKYVYPRLIITDVVGEIQERWRGGTSASRKSAP